MMRRPANAHPTSVHADGAAPPAFSENQTPFPETERLSRYAGCARESPQRAFCALALLYKPNLREIQRGMDVAFVCWQR